MGRKPAVRPSDPLQGESTQKKYAKLDEENAIAYPSSEEDERALEELGFEFVGYEDKPKPE